MEKLTSDLEGVAVYLDDILVSGSTAEEHLNNLRRLLQRLDEKGLGCRREKCEFAKPAIHYLGHLLSNHGIAKGEKADAVKTMPVPADVSSLKSFLGSLVFYSKFLPNLSTVTEPLHHLTKKNAVWKWGSVEESSFQKLRDVMLGHSTSSF